MRKSNSTLFLAVLLGATGLLLLISLILYAGTPAQDDLFKSVVELPGRFLVKSFHGVSIFIPFYFFFAGIYLLTGKVHTRTFWYINTLIIPFFLLGASIKLMVETGENISPISRNLAEVFTRPGGIVLTLAGAVLSAGLILRLWRGGLKQEPEQENRGNKEYFGDQFVNENDWLKEKAEQHRQEREQPKSFPLLPAIKPAPELKPAAGFSEEHDIEPWTEPLPETDGMVAPADDNEIQYEESQEISYWDEEDEENESGAEETEAGFTQDLDVVMGDPLPEISQMESKKNTDPGVYSLPLDGLLDNYRDGSYWEIDDETRAAAEVLRVTLEEFKIQAEVTGIKKGPVITMFEILPAPGVKLSKITNLSDNIALRLAASSVRIVAPIPGKHAVGIEIPNKNRNVVSFREMIQVELFTNKKYRVPIALGKNISGDAQIIDLTQTPHLLIAGATGSGKSVCVNSIICSVLYRKTPAEVKLMLIDPKIVELKFYNDIPHLLTPVITEPKRAFQALQYCVYEMERRYSLLDSLGVRDIHSYNKKIKQNKLAAESMPYIVIVVDEFADLMASSGKELESILARLAAMSRAVGLHLVLATQRPSIDVITGLIKANIPSRIAFMVAGKFDSRIIIDSVGAEKLLGRGDMLFTSAWDPFPIRMQGAFLSEEEVERVVEHVKTLGKPDYIDDEIFLDDEDEGGYFDQDSEDPLMNKALEIVVAAKKASASYLQRRLKIGYNRAARLVEEMERKGIVGPQNGSKPREILSVPDGIE